MAWNVYLNGKWIDCVWFDKGCDKDYVKRSLVQHDGYDINISIRRNLKGSK